jgi:tetratricopeptide (TPR) repeat protein
MMRWVRTTSGGGAVQVSYRWVTALAVDSVLFMIVWWLAESPVALDRGTALALAGFAAALVALPLGSWATRPVFAPHPPPAASTTPVEPAHIVVGALPRGAAALVARAELLDDLTRAHASGRIADVCVLTGTRGVGKTQLAAAYARSRVEQGWPVVAWIPAESEDQIVAGLAELGDVRGLRPTETDSATAARDTLRWLQHQTGPCLLVYDNAGDPDLIATWMPSVGNVHVVLTATRQAMTDLGRAVHVDLFTETEAVAYLATRTGLSDEEGARKLAAAVGHLPLALAQAAAVVGARRPHPTYRDYLDRLTQVRVGEHLRRVLGDPYSLTAAQALRMAVDEVPGDDETGLGRHLLDLLAVLSAAGVPRWLLRRAEVTQATAAGSAVLAGSAGVDAAVAHLADRSLVSLSTDGAIVSEHRLMRRVVCEALGSDGRLDAVIRAAAALVEGALVPAERAWEERHVGDDLVAQVDALAEAVEDAPAGTIEPQTGLAVLRLRQWSVRHLYLAYDPARAIALGEAVAGDVERLLGADHPDTLATQHDLARALKSGGRAEEAVDRHERTAGDRARVLGEDHPDTLESRNSLAGTYLTVARRDEAIALYERTVADRTRVLGADHADTLTSRSNLAYAYRAAGRLPEAIALYEQTVADRTRVLGADHPDTLTSRSSLAYTYLVARRPDDAVGLHERVSADRDRVLGPDHPHALTSRSGLAQAYLSARRYDEALPLLAGVLADRERLLGSDHVSTLTDRRNLATGYRSAGRLGEAIPLFEGSVADHERVLGPDHRSTLAVVRDLGYALRAAGRVDESVALLKRNLADRIRVMGSDHPETVSLRNSLKRVRRRAARRSGP